MQKKSNVFYLNVSLSVVAVLLVVNAFTGNALIKRALAQVSSITGSGTVNFLASFANAGNPSSQIGKSDVYDDGAGHVGIGTNGPLSTLSVGGVGIVNTTIYAAGDETGVYGTGIYGVQGIGMYGVYGRGFGDGVYGAGTGNGSGVYGTGGTYGVVGSGMYGVYGSGTSYGVYGIGGAYGVVANGTSYGVYGTGGTYGVVGSGTYDFFGSHGEYTSGATWVNGSSRALKENFTTVDDQAILGKIIELPITQWDYKSDTKALHIGPVAEDFYSIFGLGDDNKSISTIDPSGVALVGIKALDEKIDAQQQEIDALQAQIKALMH